MFANRGFTSALVIGGLVSIGACADREPREPAGEERRSALTSGAFVERAKLLASGGATSSELSQLAISGDTIVVGGPVNNPGPTAPLGAAYVFVRPPGGWTGTLTEQAKLVPSDGAPGDQFARVAMDGDVIVVGSYEDNINAGSNQGSVYVFVKPPGGWSGTINESAKLTASDAAGGDVFGLRVAISGDVVVVTARGDDSPQIDRGTAYVFVKPAGGWSGTLTQNVKVAASDGGDNDQFGGSVAVRGDIIVIGARLEEGPPTIPPIASEGAAYLFEKPATGWGGGVGGVLHQNAKLKASDAGGLHVFGHAVGLVGDTVVVGAPQNLDGVTGPGAAYVFERPAAGWSGTLTETAKLAATGGVNGDGFGVGVALTADGETIVVGADADDVGANTNQGALYVFHKPAAGWSGLLTTSETITAADGAAGDQFGQQLAIDGDTLLAGAPFDDIGTTLNQGSVTVFVPNHAPVLSLPANLTVEATSAAGAVVTFAATADDAEDGALTPACAPASGSTFPLGTTQVDCSVTDADGQQATGSFLVTVGDTTPPALTVPGGITAEASGPAGAVVTFSTTANDLVDGAIAPVCTPA
jgi:FG-GAP repeat/HYR domain